MELEGSSRPPLFRRLRVFALDPSYHQELHGSAFATVTVLVPWETNADAPADGKELAELEQWTTPEQMLGPVGEYVEVIDLDPMSERVYDPVDLNSLTNLAQDGLQPSETNPQFHQQMVYAVAMTTIRHFEEALGRKLQWHGRWRDADASEVRARIERLQGRGVIDPELEVTRELLTEHRFQVLDFVPRLRIYPHALRMANAYYSRQRQALLFGYFPARENAPSVSAGQTVFTCLSYDVIAHETAHAALDGLHHRFLEPSNPDALAFHEGFADLVAIFQHFTHDEVLQSALRDTGGDIGSITNPLALLAREMGQAIGRDQALRSAIGDDPDPHALEHATTPHARGTILVAAVFDAFSAILGARIEDLVAITRSAGLSLEAGTLPSRLTRRIAGEASNAARHVLRMCIRALDYCPSFDMSLGDYLRALITADLELVPYDRRNYRAAFIEAFRRRGILPATLSGFGEDSLRWQPPEPDLGRTGDQLARMAVETLAELTGPTGPLPVSTLEEIWSHSGSRRVFWDAMAVFRRRFRERLDELLDDARSDNAELERWLHDELHLVVQPPSEGLRSIFVDRRGLPAIEVHKAELARRTGVDQTSQGARVSAELVIELSQRRRGYFDDDKQRSVDHDSADAHDHGDFRYRSGCTLVIDVGKVTTRFATRSRGAPDDRHFQKQRELLRTRPDLRLGMKAPHQSEIVSQLHAARTVEGSLSLHEEEV